MSSPNSRKRPAPGAAPIPIPMMQQAYPAAQADQLLRWAAPSDTNGFVDTATTGVAPFAMYGQPIPGPTTALARRQAPSRALVPSGPLAAFDGGTEPWAGFGDDAAFMGTSGMGTDENDNIERLEEMAQRAKREAQAKRKQIPPFVQKLSSFLDESRNTDLIRWSDKGDSFVVLDEDEFAKTLIPELFKHNNYASFVRQLNMYGFHKRVGLSDNSMKASERKNKSPSEYYNPYFRRGHPNLLWLINKPKSGNSKKKGKKDEGEAESDEDAATEETPTGTNASATQISGRPASGEVAPLQKKDLIIVKKEVERLQQQQQAITSVLNKMRQEHTQLYRQALLFQSMHERHENSINAILNFLANVFRKSLEEQGGTQNVQDLLATIIPNSQGHGGAQMPQGSVVDLGDFLNHQASNVAAMGTPKRQQRLLPPIPVQGAKAANLSASSKPSAATHPSYPGARPGTVVELFDTSPSDTTTPSYMKNELQNNPQEGMMKIIQDTNAVSTSGIDLPNVAAKTTINNLSNDQRSKMLSIMAGNTSATPTPSPAAIPVASPASTAVPPTPSLPNVSDISLSPVLSALPPPLPLHELQAAHDQFEKLQQLQDDQSREIEKLTTFLGPLSPSGRIPGLDAHGNPAANSYFEPVEFDQFLDSNAFADPGSYDHDAFGVGGNADTGDFNFTLDGSTDFGGDATGAGVPGLGGVAGAATQGLPAGYGRASNYEAAAATDARDSPSPAGTEEITRSDFDGLSAGRDAKRRRI